MDGKTEGKAGPVGRRGRKIPVPLAFGILAATLEMAIILWLMYG